MPADVFAAFGNAVGNGRAAADGGFVGDFDVSDRADSAADDAVAAYGYTAGDARFGGDDGVRTDFAVVSDLTWLSILCRCRQWCRSSRPGRCWCSSRFLRRRPALPRRFAGF